MPGNPVRGAVDSLANSRGRSAQHILIGLGLTVGAEAVSALVARMNGPTEDNEEIYSDYEELVQPEITPPPKVFAAVWPPLFLSLTLSGLRIWNAPKSAAATPRTAMEMEKVQPISFKSQSPGTEWVTPRSLVSGRLKVEKAYTCPMDRCTARAAGGTRKRL